MHHIYHTEAIILGSRNVGETARGFYLFTPDLGLVYTRAQGIRKLSSRLRYVLSDYAYIKVDLVRGKDVWRITSASKTNILDGLKDNRRAMAVLVNLSRLLYRLLRGEEANENLFREVFEGLLVLEHKTNNREIESIEIMIVLRVLANLGYIGESGVPNALMRSPLADDLLEEIALYKVDAIREINRALRETHL
ncbi:MAG: DNA repair protein RecO [Candidatus Paceibacterota bacterium]